MTVGDVTGTAVTLGTTGAKKLVTTCAFADAGTQIEAAKIPLSTMPSLIIRSVVLEYCGAADS